MQTDKEITRGRYKQHNLQEILAMGVYKYKLNGWDKKNKF